VQRLRRFVALTAPNKLTGSSVPFRTPLITFSQNATLPLGITTPVCRLVADSVEKVASLNSPKFNQNANHVFDRRQLVL
jgi:hypothetical protein